jgi:ribosomal protein S12 methylthiotransferase accessory factor
MLERPTYSPQYHVEVVEPEGVYLLSERGHTVLKGAVHCRLAPLLDGRHTAAAIVDRLVDEGGASAADVYYALGVLERKGYAVEADGAVPLEQAAFWRGLGLDPMQATRRLREGRVALTAFGDVPTAPFAAALAGLGAQIVDDEATADVTLALADDYLRDGLDRRNATALATGRPWMLAKPVGSIPWIGPIFRPGTTGCWACLAQRLRGNREVEGYLQQRLGTTGPLAPSHAALPTSLRAAVELTATQAALWLARGDHPELDGRIVSLNVIGLETMRHVLVRQPQCPACGDPQACSRPRPVALASRKKAFTADGGHRGVAPEQTIARYEHHVSPITGAVSVLVRTPADEERFVQVYMAGHNFAHRQLSLDYLKKGLRSKAAGKGKSEAQAKASALCEAIERYSGIFRGDEPRRTASYRELGDAAIHPNAHMLYSVRQYAERAAWNARGSGFQIVSDPLDEDAQIEWTPLWSLTDRAFKYLPTASCYFSYPTRPDQFFSWPDSNGNAAGNTLEEAILQGFMELVERDSVALWWYNRIRRPAVDLASFDEPYFLELRERYARLARDLWVLDLTTDLGIPAFGAVSRRVDKPVEDILFAFGAHFDPRIAILRALTELNQFLPAVLPIRSDGSGEYAFDDPECRRWWRTATVADHPYLLPDERQAPIPAAAYPRQWTDDVRDDVLRCQQLVEARGLEMLVLDQTRPDLELPVAKVVVPGLRHFWTRFAPGRLYDVPVALGWLDRPLAEDELNPVAMFI